MKNLSNRVSVILIVGMILASITISIVADYINQPMKYPTTKNGQLLDPERFECIDKIMFTKGINGSHPMCLTANKCMGCFITILKEQEADDMGYKLWNVK